MKNYIKIAAIATTAALVTATSANAGPVSTLTINLSGKINEVCTVTNNGNNTANYNVDLTTANSQVVAPITYKCNSFNGFTRVIASTNGGRLKSEFNQLIPYKVSHDGTQQNGLTLGLVDLTQARTTNVPASVLFTGAGQTANFNLKLDAVPTTAFAGTYTDTVTIKINSN